MTQQIIEEKNKTLSILAELDGLTGVYNRRSFESDLRNEISDDSLVLIMFDIDYFKKINDTYGHQEGDTVLKELSTFVRTNCTRASNLATPRICIWPTDASTLGHCAHALFGQLIGSDARLSYH